VSSWKALCNKMQDGGVEVTSKYDLKLRDSFEDGTISFLEALDMARADECKSNRVKK
jgi:hypothetical protein